MTPQIKLGTAFGIVLLALVASGFVAAILLLGLQSFADPEIATSLSIFLGEAFLFLPVFIFIQSSQSNIREVFRIKPITSPVLQATIILSIGVTVIVDELDRIIGILLPPPDFYLELMENVRMENPIALFILFLGGVAVAALVEEMIFRGFLQQILEQAWKDITRAILATAIFFAAIHFNLWWTIQIYFLGILLGYLAWRTNSVFPGIILHSINNALAMISANWGYKIEQWYAWHRHVNPLLLLIAAGLIFFGYTRFEMAVNTSRLKHSEN
ncbi:MAG: lysostaphin resistance A-like protein [Fidelibacterota bacterium]